MRSPPNRPRNWPRASAFRFNQAPRGTQPKRPKSKTSKEKMTAKPCPQCRTASDQLSWFYFSSPAETWEHLCGRAGWLTVCDRCHRQVAIFMEVLN